MSSSPKWPDFEPGNEMHLKHGAYSKRRTEPVAEEHVRNLLADRDPELLHLRHPMFKERLWKWARAQARFELFTAWSSTLTLTSDPKVIRALKTELEFSVRAMRLAEQCGLTPVRPPAVEAEILLALRELGSTGS